MAALSHASALLFFMGAIISTLIWITQKDKSKYVAFQALQALTYHIVMILLSFLGMICYMGSFFLTFVFVPLSGSSQNSPLTGLFFLIPFLVFGLIGLAGFIYICYALVGAVMTLQGKDFRYLFLGRVLDKYLEKR